MTPIFGEFLLIESIDYRKSHSWDYELDIIFSRLHFFNGRDQGLKVVCDSLNVKASSFKIKNKSLTFDKKFRMNRRINDASNLKVILLTATRQEKNSSPQLSEV